MIIWTTDLFNKFDLAVSEPTSLHRHSDFTAQSGQELAKILDPVRLAWETDRSYQQARSECGMRSPQSETQQPDLLALLEKLQQAALRIETVPINLTVGVEQRFWVFHQQSGLRLLGQFTYCEAEEILKVTHAWDWTVDPRTREPACRYQLLNLLESICKPQKVFEVAA